MVGRMVGRETEVSMSRTLNRLTARKVKALTKPGRHADGGGLYLHIRPSGTDNKTGTKSWVFLYRHRHHPKKRSELGLGSLRDVSLARARELAAEERQKLAKGESPKAARKGGGDNTFAAQAEKLIATLRPSWRSPIHARQWQTTLLKDAAPLARIPVGKITTDHVLSVLEPMWDTKRATAERLRGRIEKVLDAAKARGLITASPYANPARWRGHLDQTLGKRKQLEQPHHAAMPYVEVPPFLRELRAQRGVSARALEFTILTAARSNEVLGARWSEFDLTDGVWTVPGARMKGGRSHRAPLSAAALKLITALHENRESEFVFPGRKHDQPDGTVMWGQLRRMRGNAFTVHGFRSAFRDWAAEKTSFPHEVCEQALAHTVGSAVTRSYLRGDAFEKRRELMEAWGAFCTEERGTVLAFQGRA